MSSVTIECNVLPITLLTEADTKVFDRTLYYKDQYFIFSINHFECASNIVAIFCRDLCATTVS